MSKIFDIQGFDADEWRRGFDVVRGEGDLGVRGRGDRDLDRVRGDHLGRAGPVPLEDVPYISTMLWTIGIGIGLTIVGYVIVAASKPDEADKSDIRDKEIKRFGDYVGGVALGALMIGPFVLTLAGSDHFWIANTMFAAFVLGSLVGAVTKIVAYRRGL